MTHLDCEYTHRRSEEKEEEEEEDIQRRSSACSHNKPRTMARPCSLSLSLSGSLTSTPRSCCAMARQEGHTKIRSRLIQSRGVYVRRRERSFNVDRVLIINNPPARHCPMLSALTKSAATLMQLRRFRT